MLFSKPSPSVRILLICGAGSYAKTWDAVWLTIIYLGGSGMKGTLGSEKPMGGSMIVARANPRLLS